MRRVLALMLALAGPAQAAAADPLTLAGTEVLDLGPRRAVIAWPDAPPPAAGYGLIVALDAGWTFATLRDTAGLQAQRGGVTGVRPTVVVGLGYPTENLIDQPARKADLVGPHRDQMLDTVEAAVDRVAARVPLDPDRRMILGHSFGAAFVLYALEERPGIASHWVAGSPSVWAVPDLPLTRHPGDHVLIAVGGEEGAHPPMHNPARAEKMARRDMIGRARDAAHRTGATFRIVPGEDHGSLIPGLLADAVGFLWSEG
ncbi:alpha/beta hydrolase [Mesobaculum littorinae]|uniref:Alpha/beta hydrolase n=1 Tax=Mesobaculum littorinae TaxID=2486419 RepID=A0A438AJI1_9RHOB|nr:alpha/beta hydrolase-fold protein [Mesobaculum littorinae]RVV98842.1 alpha/beta hydrolase [Mesobaculum littorinae]